MRKLWAAVRKRGQEAPTDHPAMSSAKIFSMNSNSQTSSDLQLMQKNGKKEEQSHSNKEESTEWWSNSQPFQSMETPSLLLLPNNDKEKVLVYTVEITTTHPSDKLEQFHNRFEKLLKLHFNNFSLHFRGVE